jgi:hypothetical protein
LIVPAEEIAKAMLESELYAPVKAWLIEQGYEVRGEVGKCDVAAVKGDDLIVIELKCRFSIELLVQAIERQRAADSVYIAVPMPDCYGRSKKWRGFQQLVRRLEVGLIFCKVGGRKPRVEIVFHPLPATRRKQKRARQAVLKEISGRSRDHNVGGSTRRKLITAYRENAIQIAALLEQHGEMSPKKLRSMGMADKTPAILRDNVYGWFTRVGRGVYAVTGKWQEEAGQYRHLIDAAGIGPFPAAA